MKKILFIVLALVLYTCESNDTPQLADSENKVVLLKVDFLTNTFEGGKEFVFPDLSNFTITSTYNPPGDFGDIQLYYSEIDEKIFDGTIIWMGSGEMTYPEELEASTTFTTLDTNLQIPNTSLFEKVMYSDYSYYPDPIDYSSIWEAVDNLEIVQEYRTSNPDGIINLFLYTPSVGVGDPAEWDWFIYMKN